MPSVLILLAHPALERSRLNRRLAERVRDLDGVTLHDLYEAYPDFAIDVPREQALLVEHDTVVFQHPMFWYSTPAILKEWQDLVLEHGWAYGSAGTALSGKRLLCALTTGAKGEAYTPEGFNGCSVDELLLPIERTVRLCRMRWLAPFVTYGAHTMGADDIEAAATRWRERVEALRDGAEEV
jgi:glutathione-regulated potassium-efflux system ancillary protein KefG